MNRSDLEKVFGQNSHRSTFRIPQKRRVLFLCQMADKYKSGKIRQSEFKQICLSCNYKPNIVVGESTLVDYKKLLN